MDVARALDMSKIPVFLGTSKDVITAEQWVDRIDRAKTTGADDVWTDAFTTAVAYSALKDMALMWYQQQEVFGTPMATWQDFKTAFLRSYSKTRNASTTTATAATLTQRNDESVTDFSSRIALFTDDIRKTSPQIPMPETPYRQAIRDAAGFAAVAIAEKNGNIRDIISYTEKIRDHHYAINFFMAGVRKEIQDRLHQHMPAGGYTNMRDVINLAQHYEKIIASQKTTTSSTMSNLTRRINACDVTDNDIDEVELGEDVSDEVAAIFARRGIRVRRTNRGGGRGRGRGGRGRGGGHNSSSNNNGDNERFEGDCFYCKRKGHRKANCFQMKRDMAAGKALRETEESAGASATFNPFAHQMAETEVAELSMINHLN